MASQITVTSKTGPAQTVTAQLLSNVTAINFDLARNVAQVVSNGLIKEFDIAATSTITDSVSAGNHTWVISQ